MKDYTTAQEVLNNRTSRKLENNTYLKRIDDNTIGVLLHGTYVVTYTPKKVILNSGGWLTPTTKDRINKYNPMYLTQKNSLWYMPDGSLFYDGITITNGKIDKPRLPEKTEKKTRQLKAKIKAYCNKAVEAVNKGLELPNGGDCWLCSMKTTDKKTLGDCWQDNSHLVDHMKEGYIVPSLLWNAVKAAGYQYPEIILGYNPETKKTDPKHALGFGIRQSLKKYLYKRLSKTI